MFRQKVPCHEAGMNIRRCTFEAQIANGNNRYLRFIRINIIMLMI